MSSNFFGLRDGVIWTAEEGVLAGITRSLALEVADAMGVPVELQGVREDELSMLDEAFITSASRAVLPVVEINGKAVGTGTPGPVTQRLLQGYLERVEAELEVI
jgi:branched-subunit amino acid aminotransferase/4-amino-4-deoxychorismate lyase